MRSLNLLPFAASILALVAGAWLFRYDYLPPVEHSVPASLENRAGRVVVACVADRWTRELTCNSAPVDSALAVREMEEWLKERQTK